MQRRSFVTGICAFAVCRTLGRQLPPRKSSAGILLALVAAFVIVPFPIYMVRRAIQSDRARAVSTEPDYDLDSASPSSRSTARPQGPVCPKKACTVSVVATGIEQTEQQAEEASRPFNMGSSRGPARPAMSTPASEPLFERTQPAAAPEPTPEPVAVAAPEPKAEPEAAPAAEDDWDLPAASADEPLELAEEAADAPADQGGGDELLLDASSLADADEPQGGAMPGRRRGLVSSSAGETQGGDTGGGAANAGAPAGGGGASGGGSPRLSGATLFERMASLSRGASRSDDDEDEDEGGDSASISIPRFLGRQNNQ